MATTHARDSGFETTIPVWQGEESWLHVDRTVPQEMPVMHWHSHIEINYLVDCAMTYVSGSQKVRVAAGRITVFWASIPHQVVDVEGDGLLTCIYLSLQEFTRWRLPLRFCHEVLHGGLLTALDEDPSDPPILDRWLADYQRHDIVFQRQVLDEIQLRLRRIALSGWQVGDGSAATAGSKLPQTGTLTRGITHVENMAGFIAEHYSEPISVNEVAAQVGLHPNYAMSVFKRIAGLPIAAYITRHRLSHAQAMLLDTDKKILTIAMDCGFGSLSRFYEVFRQHLHKTPRQYREEWRHAYR